MGMDALHDEAVEHAITGVFEPITHRGAFVFPVIGYERDPETNEPDSNRPIFGKTPYGIWKKSDRLLEFLLKGAKPEVYRDRVEHRDQVVQQEHKFAGSMTELLALHRELTVGTTPGE
jgi:hypothetical protein